MPEEKVIYQQRNIKITNLRAVFGDKTYAMSNITSVEKLSDTPTGAFGWLFLVLGLIVGMIALLADATYKLPMFLLAAMMIIGGVGTLKPGKPEYIVQFGSASGEIKAYTSTDHKEIEAIVAAINEAIVQKG
jgi:hypothetical protein